MNAAMFWSEYSYLRTNTKNRKPLELLIPNDIFKRINSLENQHGKELSGAHKAFAFAVYAFCKAINSKGTYHKISDIKERWGYSLNNKSLNDLIKKDGILDKAGITNTKIAGLDEHIRDLTQQQSTKIQYKDIAYDIDKDNGRFFRLYTDMMLGCMVKNQQLGATAFYVYAFICYKCQMKGIKDSKGYYDFTHLSSTYIKKCLGLSEGTVKTTIKALLECKMIKTRREFRNKIEEGYSIYDANQFLPSVELSEKVFEGISLNRSSEKTGYKSATENRQIYMDTPVSTSQAETEAMLQAMKEIRQRRSAG